MKCIVCGKESEFKICGKCFSERNSLAHLPNLEIEKCGKCGSFRFGKELIRLNDTSALEKKILEKLTLHPDFDLETFELFRNSLIVTGSIFGDRVSITIPLNLRIRTITCTRCSRESGGYYEAIVQIRAQNRNLKIEEIEKAKDIVNTILATSDGEKDFLLKFEETRFGIDFYFGSRKMGEKVSKAIVAELGGSVSKSKKLHTRIDGNDVYRFTYLIRLPEAEENDVVLKNGKICVVKNAKLQKGVEILTGKNLNISGSTLVVKRDEMNWGIITNLDESIAEVMDSEGRVFHVIRPFGAKLGKEVFIFSFEGRVFAFPRDL